MSSEQFRRPFDAEATVSHDQFVEQARHNRRLEEDAYQAAEAERALLNQQLSEIESTIAHKLDAILALLTKILEK